MVPVVDGAGVLVGALSHAELSQVFASEDRVLEWRIEDLLRDHFTTARWQVRVADALVTISGVFDDAQRWALMALLRLVPGVGGLVLRAATTPDGVRIRL